MAKTAVISGSKAVEKAARDFSDGSGALPRAMMLPRDKSRSVTSLRTMLFLVLAMSVACGGKLGYYMEKEHHDKMDVANPCNFSFESNNKSMGFRGTNSTIGSRGCERQLGFVDASCDKAPVEPEVQVLRACEKSQGVLPDRRVQVPVDEGCGVRGSDRCGTDETLEGEPKPAVQVLLACEKRGKGTGADRIQFHGSLPEGDLGACMLKDENMLQCDRYGVVCNELATMKNSDAEISNVSSRWMACAATMNVHEVFSGFIVEELYINVDNLILQYDTIDFKRGICCVDGMDDQCHEADGGVHDGENFVV
eukprot:s4238_g4.t1